METKSKIPSLHLSFLLLTGLLFLSKAATTRIDRCNNSIAECSEELEMLMESEISRRILEQKRYITPGALKPDQPVCNSAGRGEAYSKSGGCLPPSSNPEDRGCPKYYRCRSSS